MQTPLRAFSTNGVCKTDALGPILGLLALLFVFFAPFARAAEVIPPAPRDHFNDYAGVVSPATAQTNIAAFTDRISAWFEKPPAVFTCSAETSQGRQELLGVIDEAMMAIQAEWRQAPEKFPRQLEDLTLYP